MRINPGSSMGRPFNQGLVEEWEWSKNGGGYDSGRDFFSVHWEVNEPHSEWVRLHVEAPRYANDPVLNDLKRFVVEAFLASSLESAVNRAGFEIKKGVRISTESIQNFKSTEPFHLVLTPEQRKGTTGEDIEIVQAAIGSVVEEVVSRYRDTLQRHFGGTQRAS